MGCIVHSTVHKVYWSSLNRGYSTGCRECRADKWRWIDTSLKKRLAKRHTSMMQRCYNPKNREYFRYGGRGIRVAEEFHDAETYVKYILTLPNAGTGSLDRIDNNGNYEPGNIRWASQATQSRNHRRNKYVTWKNETMVFEDFARKYTYLAPQYARKLWGQGWTLEELASHRPANKGRRAQGIRLGKLRPNESVHGRTFETDDCT